MKHQRYRTIIVIAVLLYAGAARPPAAHGVDGADQRGGPAADIWHENAICFARALPCNEDECQVWNEPVGTECWKCSSIAYHRICGPTSLPDRVCREKPPIENGCGSMMIGLCVPDGEGGSTCVTAGASPENDFLCFRFDCQSYREVANPAWIGH